MPPNPTARKVSYREIFSSESVTGISAVVSAGAAVALIGEESLRDDFQILTPQQVFSLMPESAFVLQISEASQTPLTQAMCQLIENPFA